MEVKQSSDVDLLSDLDRIIDFDAKVANGALDLGVSEQELLMDTYALLLAAAIGQRAKLGAFRRGG